MAILPRLLGTEEPRLPIHQFMAALAEYKRGAITGPQIVSGFGLSPTEATQLQDFLDNLDADTVNRALIHDVLLLGERGYYSPSLVATRLGLSEN